MGDESWPPKKQKPRSPIAEQHKAIQRALHDPENATDEDRRILAEWEKFNQHDRSNL